MIAGPARPELTAAAVASLAGAGCVLAIRIAEPFDHGVWLVAYLFLVGFLAQLLLGRGQAALLGADARPPAPAAAKAAQLVLWNVGVVAVPVGVFAEVRVAVVLGSLTLLAALGSFWNQVRGELSVRSASRRWLAPAYLALLMFMAGSVLVGTALAWDTPWV